MGSKSVITYLLVSMTYKPIQSNRLIGDYLVNTLGYMLKRS